MIDLIARQEEALGDAVTAEQPDAESRTLCLCKRCVDTLRRGRYLVTRIDRNTNTRLRSCELCHTRTYCGEYEVSAERFDGQNAFQIHKAEDIINNRREQN